MGNVKCNDIFIFENALYYIYIYVIHIILTFVMSKMYYISMNTSTISTRDIQRKYKEIFEQVRQTKKPAVVMSQKEPQVAIVSLDDLDELQKLRRRNSARALLELAGEVHSLLKDENLPSDLSARHNYYLWEEDADTR